MNGVQKVGNAFYSLPAWAKGAIAVVVVYAGYKIGKEILTAPKKAQGGKGARDQEKEEIKEYQALIEAGKKPTLKKSQFNSMANVIFNAMDGYGTDEDAIVRQVKKLKNDADFLALTTAYGIREVSSGKWNPEPNYKGTLAGALQNDLSDYWISLLNKHLRSKGVKYRF